jgi:hypothetical protein
MRLISTARVLGVGLLGLCLAQPALAQIRFNFSDTGRFQIGPQPSPQSSQPRGYQYMTRPGLNNQSSSGWDSGNFGNTPRGYSNRPGNFNSGGGWNNDGWNNNGYNNPGYYAGTGSYGYNPAPSASYNPVPAEPTYAASGSPIVIMGCDETDLGFSLIANGQSWKRHVLAGKTYKCTDDREWYIQFHRGGDYGSAHYRLKPGVYEFQPGPRGWELVQKTDL